MTVSSEISKAGPFTGDGANTTFPFTFKMFLEESLDVVLYDESTDTETTLVLDTDYSISLNSDQETNPGGTVTYPLSGSPLPTTQTLTLVRDLDYLQTLDLPAAGGQFDPDDIETALDRIVMMIQQLLELVGRSLKIIVSDDSGADLDVPVPSAGDLLGWNAAGDGLRNYDPTVLAATTVTARSEWLDSDGDSDGDSITYGSSNTFTRTGNWTEFYTVGRVAKVEGTTTGTVYGIITAASYAAGSDTTTVTLLMRELDTIANDGDLLAWVGIVNPDVAIGSLSTYTLTPTFDVRMFGGADLGAKIAAAAAELPSSGGTLDATRFTGTQTFSTDALGGITVPCRIIFGPYVVEADISSDVQQTIPSNVTLVLNHTTFRPTADGQFPTFGADKGFFNTKVRSTTGTGTSGASTITLADTTGVEEGVLLAIDGASTENTDQQNTLNGGITDSATTITLNDASGFSPSGISGEALVALIDSELITYTGVSGNDLTGCTRGVFGTSAASHLSAANVTFVPKRLAVVTGLSGSVATLDRTLQRSVTSAPVEVGATRVRFEGVGLLDGRQDRSGPDSGNLFGIEMRLATYSYVGHQVRIKDWDFTGITLRAAWRNTINCDVMEGCGRPADNSGWTVGLLSRCFENTIRIGEVRDGYIGVEIEDRSSSLDKGYVGQSDDNHVYVGRIDTHSQGLVIAGNNNSVVIGECPTSVQAVGLSGSPTQWTTATAPTRNRVQIMGVASGSTNWVSLPSEAEDGGNVITAGMSAQSISTQKGNSVSVMVNLANLDNTAITPQKVTFQDRLSALSDNAVLGSLACEHADADDPGEAASVDFEAEGTVGRVGVAFNVGKPSAQVKAEFDGFGNLRLPVTASSSPTPTGAMFYVADVTGTKEMFVKDSGGTITQLSTHGFPLVPGGPSEELAWSHHSWQNGRVVNVDMLRVVRLVEQLSGEKLVFTGDAVVERGEDGVERVKHTPDPPGRQE